MATFAAACRLSIRFKKEGWGIYEKKSDEDSGWCFAG